MNALRAAILIMLLLVAACVPAGAWYWPIMGFLPPPSGCPNVCGGPALPPPNTAMLPGTFQWGYPPVDRARQVYPGCAYGPKAFQNALSFGTALPFGLSKPGFYREEEPAQEAEAAPTANVTENRTGITARANNTTISGGNANGGPGGLSGWLSSR